MIVQKGTQWFVHCVSCFGFLAFMILFQISTSRASAEKKVTEKFELSLDRKGVLKETFVLNKNKLGRYDLVHLRSGKVLVRNSMEPHQAEYFFDEIKKVIWITQYREPISSKKCTRYMTLKSAREETNVCIEQSEAMQLAYQIFGGLKKRSQK